MDDDDEQNDMTNMINQIGDSKEKSNGLNQNQITDQDTIENKLNQFNLEDNIIPVNDEDKVDYGNQLDDNDNDNEGNDQLNKAVDERLLSDENEQEEEEDDNDKDKPINFEEEIELHSNDINGKVDADVNKDGDDEIKIIKRTDQVKDSINNQLSKEQSNKKYTNDKEAKDEDSNANSNSNNNKNVKEEDNVDIEMFLNCNLNINEEVQKKEKLNNNFNPNPVVKLISNDSFLRTKRVFEKDDFQILSILGTGSYASVVKAQYQNGEMVNSIKAIKIMKKKDMEKEKKLHQIYLENEVLMDLDHPNLVGIEGAFELNEKIYIVLEYLSKGDFSDFLRMNHPLHNDTAKFYSAEIINLLEYLRSRKVVHRDLKPENIMLDDNYHLKAIDFATAKIMDKYFNKTTMRFEDIKLKPIKSKDKGKEDMKKEKEEDDEDEEEIKIISRHKDKDKDKDELIGDDDEGDNETKANDINDANDDDDKENFRETRGHTFVGTAEYVSPEVLNDLPADYGSDLWALGCMIYKMYTGKTPFADKNDYLIFQKIKKNKVDYPSFIPEDAQDLISKILVLDPSLRLGNGEPGSSNDFKALKAHPYFSSINFDDLRTKEVPYKSDFRIVMTKQSQNVGNLSQKDDKVNEEEQYKFREKTKTIATIKQDYLDKKSPWLHYNKRKVVLDSTPKIEYIEPKRNIVKGVIYLNRNCKAEHINLSVFDLITPKRTFRFKTHDESLVWVKTINDAIEKFAKVIENENRSSPLKK